MKKILTLIATIAAAMAVLTILVTGCGNENVKKLKREIIIANKKCPQTGREADLLSIKYNDETKEVQMEFSFHEENEDLISIDDFNKHKDMFVKSFKIYLIHLSEDYLDTRPLLEEMEKAQSGLSLIIKGNKSDKTFRVQVTADELKEILHKPLSEQEINQFELEFYILKSNMDCPYSVDEGMEMEKIYDNGRNVVVDFKLDESKYDPSILKQFQSQAKEGIKESLDDRNMYQLLHLLAPLDKGLVYHYYGDKSGKSVDIEFTPEELSNL